ncbi:MAG: peptidylprolyl isomerase [Actinomycetota bacterium]|nr:peptidylprolyl isomerase [Actinomycetota bacterium]
MKRLLLLIAALGLVLAACGGSSSTAATVDGSDVTVDDVNGLFYEIEGEFTDEQFAGYLSTLIQWTAIEQRAESELEFIASDDAIAAEVDTILTETGYAGDLETFMAEQNVSEDGLDQYATQLLIEDAVSDALIGSVVMPSPEDAQAEIEANPLEYTQVCASHILVETEEEAQAVEARLDAGEDFAVVATEVSVDTGSGANGGSLACASPATYVPEFAEATMTAPIGEVTEPVESQFGFHIIVVDDRTEATAEEVQSIMGDRALFDAVDQWLLDSITTADVVVTEQYGTWEIEPSPQVVPPVA